jgi:hypothetical protein
VYKGKYLDHLPAHTETVAGALGTTPTRISKTVTDILATTRHLMPGRDRIVLEMLETVSDTPAIPKSTAELV